MQTLSENFLTRSLPNPADGLRQAGWLPPEQASPCAHRGGHLLVLSLNPLMVYPACPSTDWQSYVRRVFFIPVLSLTCDLCVSHSSQGKENRWSSSLLLLVGFRLLS